MSMFSALAKLFEHMSFFLDTLEKDILIHIWFGPSSLNA